VRFFAGTASTDASTLAERLGDRTGLPVEKTGRR
jgi:hypothetical protein